MPSETKFTRDDNNNVAVRIMANDSSVSNSETMFTEDESGNVAVRVVFGEGSGGGGGDSHNLGWYATLQALQEAHPTAEAGDWAIVGSTDTVWVWDTDTSAWTDSDTKGQVTSVNNQTGDVVITTQSIGAQETLVNQTNIKSVNGNSLLGSGNLELSTFLPYPNTWTTNNTTRAFCDAIAADTSATVGKAYLGEVTISDLPAGLLNGEVVVEIMDGTTAQNKVIVLTMTSGNTEPYMWKYTYWNGGSNTSGWIGFQPALPSQSGQSGKFLKTNGSAMSWETVDALPSQTGNNGKVLMTNGTVASWETPTTITFRTWGANE